MADADARYDVATLILFADIADIMRYYYLRHCRAFRCRPPCRKIFSLIVTPMLRIALPYYLHKMPPPITRTGACHAPLRDDARSAMMPPRHAHMMVAHAMSGARFVDATCAAQRERYSRVASRRQSYAHAR